jgi:diadenosine tetraphosphate (Ap4A) HIT family hydrolase
MAHATMRTFGYPDTVIREYDHWVVQLRPKQATLGALVLINRSEATAVSELPDAAFAAQARPMRDIESALSRLFSYDKINYLTLMMVDPQVHAHVLPRYRSAPSFAGQSFEDPGWPGPPRLDHWTELTETAFTRLLRHIQDAWPA